MDTSSLIETFNKKYPPDVFPSLWDRVDALIEEGRFLVCEQVVAELSNRSDDLYTWVCDRPKMQVKLDQPQQVVVRKVLAEFPNIIDTKRGKSGGDPFVIALGHTIAGCSVLTEELRSNPNGRPKIPDVCRAWGMPCGNLLWMARQEKWSL